LLAAAGVSSPLIAETRPGSQITVGPFAVDVFPGEHGRMLGFLPHAGRLRANLRYPFRLDDYRMDGIFSFRITMGSFSALIWNSPRMEDIPSADLLFSIPLWGAEACARAARACGARWVVPIHWDDFFSPMEKPLRPLLAPPGWGYAGIRRLDPMQFAQNVETRLSGVRVLVPESFLPISLFQD